MGTQHLYYWGGGYRCSGTQLIAQGVQVWCHRRSTQGLAPSDSNESATATWKKKDHNSSGRGRGEQFSNELSKKENFPFLIFHILKYFDISIFKYQKSNFSSKWYSTHQYEFIKKSLSKWRTKQLPECQDTYLSFQPAWENRTLNFSGHWAAFNYIYIWYLVSVMACSNHHTIISNWLGHGIWNSY